MCGRFTLTLIEDLEPFFELDERPAISPRFNIAPSQPVSVVLPGSDGKRRLEQMRWGLEANRKGAGLTINARGETVERRPLFRDAFRNRRCLLPADGFYEWKKTASGKRPFHLRLRDRGLLAFAGLWQNQPGADGRERPSCAIITTEPNTLVSPIHDRMPAILPPSGYAIWLDPETPQPALKALLRPFDPEAMEAVEVGRLVNSPFNDTPDCLRPAPPREDFRQARLF